MIELDEQPYQLMIEDAIDTYPDECCGFMFGQEVGDTRIITSILRVNNSKEGDKRRRFEISPKDYLAAEKFAEGEKIALLGIYHSHPDHPPQPSEHDRVAAQPYFSYLIISVREKKFASMQSWRLNEETQFENETISDLNISTQ